MKLGSRGNDVEDVQQWLKSEGYYTGEVDGVFGPKTKRAVVKLERDIGETEVGTWVDDYKDVYLSEYLINGTEVEKETREIRTFSLSSVSLTSIANDVIRGKYGNGVARKRNLEKAGYNYSKVQAEVNSILSKNRSTTINYKIKKGDTLSQIAKTYGTTVSKLMSMNSNIKHRDRIYAGDIIKIPSKSSGVSSSTSPSPSSGGSSTNYQLKNTIKEKKGHSKVVIDEIPCYIINLNTGTKTEFYMTPESIQESKSNMYEEQIVRGRSSPFQAYSSSGAKEVSFSLSLYADYCSAGIVQTVANIRALTYPHKSTVTVSPKSLFRLGTFMKIQGIVTSVSIDWQKPYKDGVYSKADVSISMIEVDEKSRTSREVEANG